MLISMGCPSTSSYFQAPKLRFTQIQPTTGAVLWIIPIVPGALVAYQACIYIYQRPGHTDGRPRFGYGHKPPEAPPVWLIGAELVRPWTRDSSWIQLLPSCSIADPGPTLDSHISDYRCDYDFDFNCGFGIGPCSNSRNTREDPEFNSDSHYGNGFGSGTYS